jgi:hypothetical protein
MLTKLVTSLYTPLAYQPLPSPPAPATAPAASAPAPASAPLTTSAPTISSAPLPALSSVSCAWQPESAPGDDSPSQADAPADAANAPQQPEQAEGAAGAGGAEEAEPTVQPASSQADRIQQVRSQPVSSRASQERVERPDVLTSAAIADRRGRGDRTRPARRGACRVGVDADRAPARSDQQRTRGAVPCRNRRRR